MTVLIAVASRHGATEEIAEAIGKRIHDGGFAVDVVRLKDASQYGPRPDPSEYDAVVLGSGVYLGRWLTPARKFLTQHQETLASLPLWAFSSGPVGHSDANEGQPAGIAALLSTVHPISYRVFGGKLDPDDLGLAERVLVKMIRADREDDRDWNKISAWADDISQALAAGPADPRDSQPAPDESEDAQDAGAR